MHLGAKSVVGLAMGFVIVVFFAALAIIDATENNIFLLIGSLVGVGCGAGLALLFILQEQNDRREASRKAEEDRQSAERARRADLRDREQRRRSRQIELGAEGARGLEAYEQISKLLVEVEQLLRLAGHEFSESAFAPFWDAIQKAVSKLAEVDAYLRKIEKAAENYERGQEAANLSDVPFPVSIAATGGLGAIKATQEHLNKVVRTAQRNFQFATIYEQRKTNQILVAGFENLADALYGLGDRLSDTLGDLERQVIKNGAAFAESMSDLGDRLNGMTKDAAELLGDRVAAFGSNVHGDFRDAAKRHSEAVEILDNIQRRRFPDELFPDFRGRDY